MLTGCVFLAVILLGGCQNPPDSGGPAQETEVAAAPSAPNTGATEAVVWPGADEIRAHMKAVFGPELQDARRDGLSIDWTQSVFYIGVSAVWHATGDSAYHDALLEWGNKVHWQPGARARHADDFCCGQVFLEVFQSDGGPEHIAAMKEKVDAFLAAPKPGHEDWSWCDAFFMAPPVFAKLSQATGDAHYREAMHPLFWDAAMVLWSEKQQLFYRDVRYIKSGVFWSRGDGWVLAGLARIMECLPENDPVLPRYEAFFVALAKRVVQLQGADGAWRANLLNPKEFPQPESSGTALFAYGLAWGIDHNLLAREEFGPAVAKAWAALKRAQLPNGQLGRVQQPGHEPDGAAAGDTAPYGAGAFLMLGAELLTHPAPPASAD